MGKNRLLSTGGSICVSAITQTQITQNYKKEHWKIWKKNPFLKLAFFVSFWLYLICCFQKRRKQCQLQNALRGLVGQRAARPSFVWSLRGRGCSLVWKSPSHLSRDEKSITGCLPHSRAEEEDRGEHQSKFTQPLSNICIKNDPKALIPSAVDLKLNKYCRIFRGGRHFRSLNRKGRS